MCASLRTCICMYRLAAAHVFTYARSDQLYTGGPTIVLCVYRTKERESALLACSDEAAGVLRCVIISAFVDTLCYDCSFMIWSFSLSRIHANTITYSHKPISIHTDPAYDLHTNTTQIQLHAINDTNNCNQNQRNLHREKNERKKQTTMSQKKRQSRRHT